MTRIAILRSASLLSMVFVLAACVSSKPIESKHAIDDSPLLFFTVEGAENSSGALGVYIDDLYMGDAEVFSAKNKGLVVLPGTHIVEVKSGHRILTSQKIYVGSGVSKTITVQNN